MNKKAIGLATQSMEANSGSLQRTGTLINQGEFDGVGLKADQYVGVANVDVKIDALNGEADDRESFVAIVACLAQRIVLNDIGFHLFAASADELIREIIEEAQRNANVYDDTAGYLEEV